MKALAVLGRDLLKFKRNPVVAVASVLLPLVYLVVLGNAFQGRLRRLPLAVVNLDSGPYGRRLLFLLESIEKGPETFHYATLNDPAVAMKRVKDGELKGALVIPEGFSQAVSSDRLAELGLYTDNVDTFSSSAIYAAVSQALPYLRREYNEVAPTYGEIALRNLEIYPRVDYVASLVPGAVVMAIFMGTLVTGGFNLVMDRFLGVHESYLATPLRKRDIAWGMIASGLLVTTVSSVTVFLFGLLLTGVRAPGGFAAYLAILGVIVLAGLGLLALMFILLGRVGHPRIVGLLGGFLNVLLFFPSGALYPVASFPTWLRAFAKVDPETYAVSALRSLLFKGVSFAAVRGDLLFLALFAVVMLSIGTLTFKRTL